MSEEEQEYEAPETEVEEQEEESYEDQARRMGWHPDGGPLTAEEFVKRGQENLSLLRSNFKRLEEQNRKMQSQIEDLVGHMGEQRRNAYEQAMRDLQNQQRQAVEQGDVEAFDRAAKDLNDLNSKVQKEADKPKPNPNPDQGLWSDPEFGHAFESFKAGNPWYDRDIGATTFFEQVHDRLLNRQDLTHEQRMDMAKKETARAFPDIAKNPRRDRPGAVNEPGGGKGKREKHFSDIPADDRATFERLLQNFPKEKHEEQKKRWAKRYFEGE